VKFSKEQMKYPFLQSEMARKLLSSKENKRRGPKSLFVPTNQQKRRKKERPYHFISMKLRPAPS
jgi:hypothetical protein